MWVEKRFVGLSFLKNFEILNLDHSHKNNFFHFFKQIGIRDGLVELGMLDGMDLD